MTRNATAVVGVTVSANSDAVFTTGVRTAVATRKLLTKVGHRYALGAHLVAIVLVVASPVRAAPLAYVANFVDQTVAVIDTATNALVGPPIPVGRSPSDVATTPDGTRVYVTNLIDGTVSVIDTATAAVSATLSVGAQPLGIAIASGAASVDTGDDDAGGCSIRPHDPSRSGILLCLVPALWLGTRRPVARPGRSRRRACVVCPEAEAGPTTRPKPTERGE